MAKRVPIRWRLTAWYTLLLTAILLVFAVGFYVGQRRLLVESLDTTLDAQAGLTFASLDARDTTAGAGTVQISNPEAGDQFIVITDEHGQVSTSSGTGVAAGPADLEGVAAALEGETSIRWVVVGDRRMRVLSQPLRGNDGAIYGALQIGITDEELTETLGITITLVAILIPIAIIASGLSGYWFARRALKPVDTITQLAAGIEADDLEQRIDLPLPQDEIGRLAQTFNSMLDRIQNAFNRQRQFAADASHELRTPLTLMRSQLELALSQSRDPEIDQATLNSLATDVDRLTSIVSALLTLTRGDVEQIRLVVDLVNVDEVIDLIAEQYQMLASSQGVQLRTETEPLQIHADEDLLIQVLVNLVDNALRHTDKGKKVTIGCRSDRTGADIWVADEGIGIATEHMPYLFDRFYRVDQSRNRASGGIGLGLSICKMIVDAHNGTIDIESVVSQGTTVHIWLPDVDPSDRQIT